MEDSEKEEKQEPVESETADTSNSDENGVAQAPEQTEKSQWWRSKRALVSLGVLVILSLVALVLILSSNTDDPANGVAEDANDSSAATDRQEVEQPDEFTLNPTNSVVAPFALERYSNNQNGSFYGLAAEGTVWLDRSEYSWDYVTRWNDWILFSSVDSTRYNDINVTQFPISIHAFNLSTREYHEGPTITPSQNLGLVGQLNVRGDYLYFGVDEYKADGAVYRCELTDDLPCEEVELFYEGSGTVFVIDDETIFAYDLFGDAGFYSNVVSVFNPADESEVEIAQLGGELGIGDYDIGLSDDGLLWISEVTGDTDLQWENETRELVRLYAIDKTGAEIREITVGDFPLSSPLRLARENLEDNQVLFGNDTQEVIFDVDSGSFGDVRPLTVADDSSGSDFDPNSVAERLNLPEVYTIEFTTKKN